MLEYLKHYYVFMIVLMVFSFLVPREEYKVYIQFFVGIFLIVLLLKPILEVGNLQESNKVSEVFEDINKQIEEIDLEKGENMYEYFFVKGKGE